MLVGVASVIVADRVLDSADSEAARTRATALHDMLVYETRVEGDAPAESVDEVFAEAQGENDRVALAVGSLRRGRATPIAPGTCTTEIDGRTWRMCAIGDAATAVTVGVPIDVHIAAVAGLAKGMVLVIVLALGALAIAIRRAMRQPLSEIEALVEWTSTADRIRSSGEAPRTIEIAKLQMAFDKLVQRLLDALDREKTVTAHIAHELRTPVTAMIAELESIPGTERVRGDARRLADVIDAILVLSDPAADTRDVVNVADVARELAPQGIEIVAPDEALVQGDERLIALAIRNLIENADRHAGGVRSLRVSCDDDDVRLTVSDAGSGLEAGERDKMFDRYWRGTPDGDGRGLGLALVRVVAERHNGRAFAEPGAPAGLAVSMTLGPIVGWHEAR